MTRGLRIIAAALLLAGVLTVADHQSAADHRPLVTLFDEFLAFERSATVDGAPDYTAPTLAKKRETLHAFQSRLAAINPASWAVDQQVDHALVRAQLHGLDFYLRVLQPWARDPAFYKSLWTGQSDTPEHEGPTHHAVVELWTYSFPLSPTDEARLAAELRTIPPLLTQAQRNLTGNARDLWITGTGTMQTQVTDLAALARRASNAGRDVTTAIADASRATESFVAWLQTQAASKTGPSGIGKERYSWSLRKVHLVPMSWEDEVTLLKRELDRAHASLKLEELRNQGKPALTLVRNQDEFAARAECGRDKIHGVPEKQTRPDCAGLPGTGSSPAPGWVRA